MPPLTLRVASMTALLLVLAVGIAMVWLDRAVRTTIEVQAEASAWTWLEELERSFPSLEGMLSGEPLTPAQRQFIDATMVGSDVFEVQLFDRNGREVFDSNAAQDWMPGEHYLRAREVAATGLLDLTVETGDPAAGEPARYVEAYIPVHGDADRTIGAAELYIDASASAAALREKFGWAGIFAIALTVMVFVAPGVAFVREHEKLRRREAEMRDLARRDSLTGLLNRRGLRQALDRKAADLPAGMSLCFLHIDLDRFKPVNDVFGHYFGDRVLATVGDRLRAAAGPDDLLARVGGDEFLICTAVKEGAPPEMTGFAEALREDLAQPVFMNGQSTKVGASIGLWFWAPDDRETVQEALQDADIALNAAKARGRGQVVIYEPAMRDRSVETARLGADIGRGLEAGEFTAHFQPIVDTERGAVDGFEALARWNHPTRGLLTPDDFLDAAEVAGLSGALDRAALQEAIRLAQDLKHRGRTDVRISLNLSAGQIQRQGIVDQYLWLMNGQGVEASQFRIEVLESVLLDERASEVPENIRRFRAAGFLIDLDDFGTGHTAIDSLRRFEVDRIKLDRSLVGAVDSDPRQAILTDALVKLAARLDLPCLAEGVETEAERRAVSAMGCTLLQGYLLGQPMPRQTALESLTVSAGRKRSGAG